MDPKVAIAETGEETGTVDAACTQVLEAVVDRRSNGGPKENVRAATFKLIEKIFEDLELDDR